MTATAENVPAITLAEMTADAAVAGNMLVFLKDVLSFHLGEAESDGNGGVTPFNAKCVRDLRRALEVAVRDGAGCNADEIASVIAGDFLKD